MNDATSTPNQADVDALRGLLDLMANFESNDQRARYLLSSNWMRDRDAAVKAEALSAYADYLMDDETAPGAVVPIFHNLKRRAEALRSGEPS
jgi:hypothetical protein